jgi:hypothetical protein
MALNENKLAKIYYSPKGYWRGISAINKLAIASGVSQEETKNWLKKTSNVANIFTCSEIYS